MVFTGQDQVFVMVLAIAKHTLHFYYQSQWFTACESVSRLYYIAKLFRCGVAQDCSWNMKCLRVATRPRLFWLKKCVHCCDLWMVRINYSTISTNQRCCHRQHTLYQRYTELLALRSYPNFYFPIFVLEKMHGIQSLQDKWWLCTQNKNCIYKPIWNQFNWLKKINQFNWCIQPIYWLVRNEVW
jgi:hypothetical protein